MTSVSLLLVYFIAGVNALTSCTNHPNGYCVNSLQYSCPPGTYTSYSGCGLLEQCCYPSVTQAPSTTQRAASATTHTPSVEQCGIADYNSHNKIVGGNQTVIEKYPWQVSVQYRGYHTCGGTIISDRWILTAAHCIKENTAPIYADQFTVVAGSSNKASFSRVSNYYEVDQILTHSGYVINVRNDIALIKLSKSMDLTTRQKRAICLPDPGEDYTGQLCVATGWGATISAAPEKQDSPLYLREVTLPVVSHSLCSLYVGSVDSNNLCAGQRTGGKDTCQGDSGGPLVCQNSRGVWKQIGIVSYGHGCALANTFGVYTDVSKFRTWIRDTIARH